MNKLRAMWMMAFAVWAALVLGAWCVWGWQLDWIAPVWERMGYFPGQALIAGGSGLLNFIGFAALGFAVSFPFLRTRRGAEAVALCFLVGTALYATLMGFAGFTRFIAVFMFMMAIAPFVMALAWKNRSSFVHGFKAARWKAGGLEGWVSAFIIALVFLAALAPAVESDGLRYHLPLVTAWQKAGRFTLLPMSANSNLPALQSLLSVSLILPFIDQGRLYQLLHAMHFAAMALLCGAIARRIYLSSATGNSFTPKQAHIAASVAALAVVSFPVTAIVAAWPFADVASCAYIVAAIAAAEGGILRKGSARCAIVGLLLGACVASKLSNAPLVAIAGVYYLAQALAEKEYPARHAALLLVFAALVPAPWMLKNLLYQGNPVYPLAYSHFGGPEWSAANDIFYKSKVLEKGMGRGLMALIESPFNVTAHWDKFEQHNPGPLPLALLPVCIAAAFAMVKNRRARIAALPLCLIAGGWIGWFFSYQSVRFLIPEFALMAVVGVPFLLANAGRWFAWMRGGLILLCLAGIGWVVYYRLVTVPVYQAAVGLIDQDLFITSRFNAYPAVRWLEENTKQDETVFYIGEHRAGYAYHYTPMLSDWFDTPRVLSEIIATKDNDALLARWKKMNIRFVLLNLKELSGYEATYFRPRFTDAQWDRYVKLRDYLLQHVAYDSGDGIYVARIDGEAGDGEKTLPKS